MYMIELIFRYCKDRSGIPVSESLQDDQGRSQDVQGQRLLPRPDQGSAHQFRDDVHPGPDHHQELPPDERPAAGAQGAVAPRH